MEKETQRKELISIYDNYKLDSEIKNTDKKYCFIFYQRELLLINNQVPLIKDFNEISINEDDFKNCLYIGEYYSKDCFAVELDEDFNKEKYLESDENYEFFDLYLVFDIDEETITNIVEDVEPKQLHLMLKEGLKYVQNVDLPALQGFVLQ